MDLKSAEDLKDDLTSYPMPIDLLIWEAE